MSGMRAPEPLLSRSGSVSRPRGSAAPRVTRSAAAATADPADPAALSTNSMSRLRSLEVSSAGARAIHAESEALPACISTAISKPPAVRSARSTTIAANSPPAACANARPGACRPLAGEAGGGELGIELRRGVARTGGQPDGAPPRAGAASPGRDRAAPGRPRSASALTSSPAEAGAWRSRSKLAATPLSLPAAKAKSTSGIPARERSCSRASSVVQASRRSG